MMEIITVAIRIKSEEIPNDLDELCDLKVFMFMLRKSGHIDA